MSTGMVIAIVVLALASVMTVTGILPPYVGVFIVALAAARIL